MSLEHLVLQAQERCNKVRQDVQKSKRIEELRSHKEKTRRNRDSDDEDDESIDVDEGVSEDRGDPNWIYD